MSNLGSLTKPMFITVFYSIFAKKDKYKFLSKENHKKISFHVIISKIVAKNEVKEVKHGFLSKTYYKVL